MTSLLHVQLLNHKSALQEGSLVDLVNQYPKDGERLPLRDVLTIFLQVKCSCQSDRIAELLLMNKTPAHFLPLSVEISMKCRFLYMGRFAAEYVPCTAAPLPIGT